MDGKLSLTTILVFRSCQPFKFWWHQPYLWNGWS